jgi:hypothetical protein
MFLSHGFLGFLLYLAGRLIQLSLSLERLVMHGHTRGLFNPSFDLILRQP